MRRFEMDDDRFRRIEHLLPGKPGDPGATAKDNRLFLDAVLWVARTGAPWNDLPARFGPYDTAYQPLGQERPLGHHHGDPRR